MTYTRLYRGHNSTREPIYIFIYKSSNRHNNENTEMNSGDSSGSP